MFTKFLTLFGLSLIYLLLIGGTLTLLVVLIGRKTNYFSKVMIPTTTAAILIGFTGFIWFLHHSTQNVFYFQGQGQPLALTDLQDQLMRVNNFDAPVKIDQKDDQLIARWNYDSSNWWKTFQEMNLRTSTEIMLSFDEEEKLVTMTSKRKSLKLGENNTDVKVGSGFFSGAVFNYQISETWGIKENFQSESDQQYAFTSSEITNPLLNEILNSGWDVNFGIW